MCNYICVQSDIRLAPISGNFYDVEEIKITKFHILMIYSIVTSALNKNLRQDQIKLNRLRKICLNYVVTDVGLSFREPTSSFCTADGMHIAAIFVYDTHKHWTVNAQHDD